MGFGHSISASIAISLHVGIARKKPNRALKADPLNLICHYYLIAINRKALLGG